MARPLKEQSPRSPEREALRIAIDAVDKAGVEVVRRREAVTNAQAACDAARNRLSEASAASAAARTAQAKVYESAIEQGHPPPRDETVQQCSQAESDARDEVSLAESALERLRTKLSDAENAQRDRRNDVTTVIRAIVDGALEPMLEETKRLEREVAHRRLVLSFLNASCRPEFSLPSDPDIRQRVSVHSETSVVIEHYNPRYGYPELDAWKEALNRLTRDADAPLPPVSAST